MAVIPKLVLDYPDYHVEIRRFHMVENELIFFVTVNDVDLCTATWVQNSHWELRECSITIEDMQDVVLHALLKHIKLHSHGIFMTQGLFNEDINKKVVYQEFKKEVAY